MAPSTTKLEERLSGLISQLAITNEGMMNLTKIAEKHEDLLYGVDERGGLVTKGNVSNHTLEEHAIILDRLETSCSKVVSFMESQVKINEAQDRANQNINRVLYGLAGVLFLVLLLIGASDISALHTLLTGVHLP